MTTPNTPTPKPEAQLGTCEIRTHRSWHIRHGQGHRQNMWCVNWKPLEPPKASVGVDLASPGSDRIMVTHHHEYGQPCVLCDAGEQPEGQEAQPLGTCDGIHWQSKLPHRYDKRACKNWRPDADQPTPQPPVVSGALPDWAMKVALEILHEAVSLRPNENSLKPSKVMEWATSWAKLIVAAAPRVPAASESAPGAGLRTALQEVLRKWRKANWAGSKQVILAELDELLAIPAPAEPGGGDVKGEQ